MKRWKCTVCGYIHEGNEPPEKCPLCHAPAGKFVEVLDESIKKSSSSGDVAGRRWECGVCGYIHNGDRPPEKCPLCGVSKEKFVEIDSAGNKIVAKVRQETVSEREKTAEPTIVASPSSFFEFIRNQILRHHLHPISVHFPNGVLPTALVFLLIGGILQISGFELAAFFNFVFVLLNMPIVMLAGYLEWQNRYNGALTLLFKVKIASSLVVIVCLTWLVGWRIINPDVMAGDSPAKWMYITIAVVMVGAAGIAGHLGGKLVFGARD